LGGYSLWPWQNPWYSSSTSSPGRDLVCHYWTGLVPTRVASLSPVLLIVARVWLLVLFVFLLLAFELRHRIRYAAIHRRSG
jgi:hypothetical protein